MHMKHINKFTSLVLWNSRNEFIKTKFKKIISFFVFNAPGQTGCFYIPLFPICIGIIFPCLCCTSTACSRCKVRTIIVNKKVGAFFYVSRRFRIVVMILVDHWIIFIKTIEKNKRLFLKQTYSHLRRDALKRKVNAINGIIYCNIRVQMIGLMFHQ